MSRPVILMCVAGVLVVTVFVILGVLFTEAEHQRRASCEATTSALVATRSVAEAGIRPVSLEIPAGIPPELAESFKQQQAATLAENTKRRAVIASLDSSIVNLQNSSFCQ
jgi:hypothetical protein